MKYDLKKELKSTVESLTISLSTILIIAFVFSLLARLGWLFDLGSHFVIQYIIGATLLTPALFYCKKPRWALIVLVIGIASIAEFYQYHRYRYHYQQSAPIAETGKTITVVQYNRLAAHFKHTSVIEWLRAQPFDIVILQEANKSLSADVSRLKDIYPYQIHEPRSHAFGMIILSKHKLQEAQKVKTGGTFYLKIKLEKYDGLPITLYALHAMVPIGITRNIELRVTSEHIAKDSSERIIFMGDWNITPFSPHFKDVLKTTKLTHQDTSTYPAVTWPTVFMLPIFQIPIDQILFSPNLQLIEKNTGPAMGSDHYPLIATFGLTPVIHGQGEGI